MKKKKTSDTKIRINKNLRLDPHLWPTNITTLYLSFSVLIMKTIVTIAKYKVFNRGKQ